LLCGAAANNRVQELWAVRSATAPALLNNSIRNRACIIAVDESIEIKVEA
jgi:hypothetical protein